MKALPGERVSQGGCAAPHSHPGPAKNKNDAGLGDSLAADAALVIFVLKITWGFFVCLFFDT